LLEFFFAPYTGPKNKMQTGECTDRRGHKDEFNLRLGEEDDLAEGAGSEHVNVGLGRVL
jgi:hypothetical protein